MIKVSVIVPIHNSEKHLDKCINSLINQTEKNIEIILINDGSTDSTEEIIKKYDDKRIKYFSQENKGIGKTRNKGINMAKGEYIMFIDSDDFFAENCVEVMCEQAKKNKSDLVISNFYKVIDNKNVEIKMPYFEPSSLSDNPEIMNMINLGPCNKLYRRDLLKSIRFEERYKYEDVPFVLNVLNSAKRITKIDDCLSYYVIHSNSETTIRDERIFDIITVCKKSYNMLKKNNDNMKDNLTNLFVMILTDYTAQCRYINNRKIRKDFINEAFALLDYIDKDWRKCKYFKNLNIISQLIKSKKALLNLYCDTVGVFYRLKKN